MPPSSTQLIGTLEVHVPMAGLIDTEAEIQRLTKQVGKLEGDIKGLTGKLNNPGFTDKAPAEVVARERGRLADAERQRDTILSTIESLNAL